MIYEKKQWFIERILNSKMHYDKLKYLIRWKDCTKKNDMYLFLKKFSKIKKLIRKFMIEYFNKLNKKAKKMFNVEINLDESDWKNENSI